MRELTAIEIDVVSGAGWLQDSLKTLGATVGKVIYNAAPLQITESMTIHQAIPELGEAFGATLGNNLGGAVEKMLSNVPVIGGLLNKLLGN